MRKTMLILLGLLLILALAGYGWYTRHPTVADVLAGQNALPASEAEAISALLGEAGLDPQQVRVVETVPDHPCWSYDHWSRLDNWLYVYRRFGRFPGYTNCIGIDRGHVVSLSVVGTTLAHLQPLARLPELRTMYLDGNRIERLAGVPEPCRWTHLHLASNALVDLDVITQCAHLETLDVSHNRLTALPALRSLNRLTKLDAGNNEIADAAGLAAHPSLRTLNLYGNHLVTLDGLSAMPLLESVAVSSNRLTSLKGLRQLPRLERLEANGNQLTTLAHLPNLPALRYLSLSSNQLTELSSDWVAVFPGLREVNLADNHLREIPAGFVSAEGGRHPAKVQPKAGGSPVLDLSRNPIASVLEQDAVARHDGAAIHHVADLPRGGGRFQGSTRRGSERQGALSSGLDVSGTAVWFEGAQSISFDLNRGVVVTATASVEKGRLRLYLEDRDGGYRYAEAIPGKPLRLSGPLISLGRGYFIYLESVDGRVEGLRWAVSN